MIIYMDGEQIEVDDDRIVIYDPFPTTVSNKDVENS